MKVIFLKDYQKTAKRGQLKEVADGLARNFLFPQKIACPATQKKIKEIEKKLQAEKAQKIQQLNFKKQLAEKIKDKKIVLKRKATKEKIFGSIGKKEILEAMKQQNWEVAEEDFELPQTIKKIGCYELIFYPKEKFRVKFFVEIEAE